MLSALGASNTYVNARFCDHTDGPFICPGCRMALTLKKGTWQSHHFAHQPDAAPCTHSEGESELHEDIKMDIYTDALKTKGVSSAHIEYRIGKRITDVAIIGVRRKVAVEIQISPMKTIKMLERMADHAKEGFATLWVCARQRDLKEIRESIHEKSREAFSVRAVEKDAFWMHAGSLFVYAGRLQFYSFYLLNNDTEHTRCFLGGNKTHLFNLVDEERKARGFDYRVAVLPPKVRWWEKYYGKVRDPTERLPILNPLLPREAEWWERTYGIYRPIAVLPLPQLQLAAAP